MSHHTIIEPFRIKSVEALKFTTRGEREAALADAGDNVFQLRAEDVLIDLLTDSGTGAMSSRQWGALMQGDESYAGSRSFFRFRDVVKDLTGFEHIIPTHQGRAAERILFHTQVREGQVVPNNNHFDTTRANIEVEGAEARDMVIAEGRVPSAMHPFKGNIDLEALERLLVEDQTAGRTRVPLVMVTDHQQFGGRTAGVAGEPPRRPASLRHVSASRSSWTPVASPRTPTSSSCASPDRVTARPATSRVRCFGSPTAARCRRRRTGWRTSAAFSR